jgi:hypothetical protein
VGLIGVRWLLLIVFLIALGCIVIAGVVTFHRGL